MAHRKREHLETHSHRHRQSVNQVWVHTMSTTIIWLKRRRACFSTYVRLKLRATHRPWDASIESKFLSHLGVSHNTLTPTEPMIFAFGLFSKIFNNCLKVYSTLSTISNETTSLSILYFYTKYRNTFSLKTSKFSTISCVEWYSSCVLDTGSKVYYKILALI